MAFFPLSRRRSARWLALLLVALLTPLSLRAQSEGVVRAQGSGARLVLTEVLRLGSESDRRGDLLAARVGGDVPQVALFRYRIERAVR